MADPVALAKKAERDRRELFERLERLEAAVNRLADLIEHGAAQSAPNPKRRSTRAKDETK